MKFCICNEIFQDWPLTRQFEVAADIGFDAIEIAPFTINTSVRDIDQETRQRIRRLAQDSGVEVAGLHWLLAQTEGYHLTDPDPTVRGRTIKYMQALVKFGVETGGSLQVVGSPQQRNVKDGVSYEQAWEWFKEAMIACAEVPGAEGFIICIEPLAPETNNNFITHAEEARRMVREIDRPNVKVILDTYSGTHVEDDFPAQIRQTGDLLGHFHCNDYNQRAPGWGDTDFVPIMRALLDIGYQGYCSIEVFNFEPDPYEHAARGLATLKQALSEAGKL